MCQECDIKCAQKNRDAALNYLSDLEHKLIGLSRTDEETFIAVSKVSDDLKENKQSQDHITSEYASIMKMLGQAQEAAMKIEYLIEFIEEIK